VIDTAGIPTENGCPVDAGRVPDEDADVVKGLKAQGAIVLGKTVTTELAFLHPNKTRNPVNPGHTPGGSSSGSAAAVADAMVPLAIGTQTGGSVCRPASFCGVAGLKPTFDAIPRNGTLMQSHTLDTLGVFARDPDGAALLADALVPGGIGLTTAPAAPRLGLLRPPGWERADPVMTAGLEALCRALGDAVVELETPAILQDTASQRAVINAAEMAHYYGRYLDEGAEIIGPPTRAEIEKGRGISATAYLAALDHQAALKAALAPLFASVDALICPAALGPAPETLASTGDSIFNGLWTLSGAPSVSLPLLTAPNGLPMGVQLVAAPGHDGALMAVADWLCKNADPIAL